jgi:hypothetical protein
VLALANASTTSATVIKRAFGLWNKVTLNSCAASLLGVTDVLPEGSEQLWPDSLASLPTYLVSAAAGIGSDKRHMLRT